jgi:hypothetical protein
MQIEFEIQKVLTTYSQAASTGDWDAAVGAYLPEGTWAIPHLGMRLKGRAAIREALVSFMSGMDYVIQMNAPAVIQVDGANATARSGIRECGKSKGKDEGFEFLGFYVDRLVRSDDGWQFVERVFEGRGTHYFPLSKAEAH